jgi:hypothetical protein
MTRHNPQKGIQFKCKSTSVHVLVYRTAQLTVAR